MARELEFYQQAERSIVKKYRRELWTPFITAVQRYELVREGDRIAVCVSGGKDSMLLAKLMQELHRHGHTPFEVVYLCMDPGYNAANRARIEENAEKIGKLAIFGSSASGKSTYKKIRAFAESKGVSVIDREFVCPGHFLFMHKKRPDENDLKKVADFAREIAGI